MGNARDAGIDDLEQLYRKQYRRFFRLAFAVVGTRESAADVVHEAFVRAIRGRSGVRDSGALEGWVWRTVLNVSLTHKAARQPMKLAGEDLAERGVEASNGRAEEWPELRAAIAALPERQRTVLFLRHYADLGYEQIAEVLGIARGTVAATLNQAHMALRKTFEVTR